MHIKYISLVVLLPLLIGCTKLNQNSDAKIQQQHSPTLVQKAEPTSTVTVNNTSAQNSAISSSSTPSRDALLAAIQDEYKAITLYSKVIATFGDANPFTNIRQSEQTHIDMLKPLLAKYNIPVPDNTWSDKIAAPVSREEACVLGVQAEKDNAAMYDRFLGDVKEQDIRDTFTFLRDASIHNHLPAFERCGDGNQGGMGGGSGQGNGNKVGR